MFLEKMIFCNNLLFMFISVSTSTAQLAVLGGESHYNTISLFDLSRTDLTSDVSVTLVRRYTQSIHYVWQSGYTSHQGSLYIAGGSSSDSFSVFISDSEEFTSLSDMTQSRKWGPGMFVLDDRVYVVAGRDDSGSWLTSMSSIPLSGGSVWQQEIATLDIGVRNTGSAVIGQTAYLAGGVSSAGVYSSRLYSWMAGASSWTSLRDMNTARSWHCVVSVQGDLYVLGGYNGNRLSSVEKYDPQTDEWTDRQYIPTPLSHAACSVWNELIFMSGGFTGSDYDVINIYNVLKNTWTQSETRLPYADEGLVSHIEPT